MTGLPVTAETPAEGVHEEQLVVQRGTAPPRKLRYENLTGQQKVAIVLAQLRHETSSVLLKAAGDEEAVLLATEIANLPPLDREVVGRVVEEFVGKLNTTRSIGQGGLAQARRMLTAAIGEERAAQVMPHLQGNVAAGPLAFLSQADPGHVVPLLVDEHPQTVAVRRRKSAASCKVRRVRSAEALSRARSITNDRSIFSVSTGRYLKAPREE
jgi:hypothetical protein